MAVTIATAAHLTSSPNPTSAAIVDLSQPTFQPSPSVNANPGANALINLATTIPELRTLLVLEHGHVVTSYTRSDVDDGVPYKVISTTKSWLSLVMGMMIQDGQVGLDETLGDIFDDSDIWRHDGANDGHQHENQEDLEFRQSITVKDLLTMTSGLQLPATTFDADGNEHWNDGGGTLKEALLDPVRISILSNDQDNQTSTKTKFHYLGANNIMSYICKQRSKYSSPREYLSAKVFPSLGISNNDIDWRTNKEGMEYSYHGLLLTTTQMAKLGQLYLQGGQSNDTHTLINKEWVTQSTSQQAGNTDYGYLWWIPENSMMFCAQGLGGQDICVSPLTDRVVVQQRDFNFAKQDKATTAMGLAELAFTPNLSFSI